ncbi:hypothetical protein [Terriglobus roseus]|uniref:Uncharacterized protein n=1 Tax=Terriglobus roseus TaxID=392734 RepID=A0A1G7GGL6_9BACT|nr:hypothetical protein [Terriglobus roseus]SDE87241.1 hypothetical protein SAMN05444167_0689 [Terriglobus roseus]
MGWLDIIPLLQKVVPLLARGVPMLEVFVNSRGNAREEMRASFDQFTTQVRDDITSHNAELSDALAANTERLGHLSSDVARLRSITEAQATQITATKQQMNAMAAKMRLLVVLISILVVLCICLLVLYGSLIHLLGSHA